MPVPPCWDENWYPYVIMVLNPEKGHFVCIGQKIDDTETF